MIGQGPSTNRADVPISRDTSLGIELLPREEPVGNAKVFERSKFYPSQSAETSLKDSLELNPSTVLDPRHTTTSLSTNQVIQFASAVDLKGTFASYGLLEDLLVLSKGLGAHGFPGGRAEGHHIPVPLAFGVIVSQSQSGYSLPTVTGLTFTSGSDAVTDLCRSSVDIPSSYHERAIVHAVDLEDVPLAVIADQERARRLKEKKKVAEPYKMSGEAKPNLIPKGSIDAAVTALGKCF